MLTLPIYLRGSSYYLHTRILGKQYKRSLGTSNKAEAIILALEHLKAIEMTIKIQDLNLDLTKLRKYELDLEKGIVKSDGPEDHSRLMEALALMKSIRGIEPSKTSTDTKSTSETGLTLLELLDKFLKLTPLKAATTLQYRHTIEEFSNFVGNRKKLHQVLKIDISNYQEWLIDSKKTHRTIDNKVGILRTLFNFAIKHGYYFSENPASNKNLMKKKDKANSGYEIFELNEIKKIFQSDFLKTAKEKDPDYFWTLVLGLLTGCRISEITSLKQEQFKTSEIGNHYIKIDDSKTPNGIREIPIPKELFSHGLGDFIKDKKQVFKYQLRLGKGSGNAVGKKFKRHLEELNITREKLVFHSLRKFVNDYMMKSNIQLEPRCQLLGHSIENVNVSVYSKQYSIDELNSIIKEVQNKLMSFL